MVAGATAWQQAQDAVLGACLIDPKAVPKVLSGATAKDFDGFHRPIWLAIAEVFRSGDTVDPVVISSRLGDDQTSRTLMLQLMDATPTAANVDAYLDVLQEQGQLRDIQALAMDLAAAPTVAEAHELTGKLSSLLADRRGVEVYSMTELAAGFLERHMDKDKQIKFLPWGLPQLDSNLFVSPGSFVILGGYPSEGKTALAIQFALYQSKHQRVGIFSLETKPEPLFDRAAAHESGVSLGRIHRSELDKDDLATVAPALHSLGERKLWIFRTAGLTVQDIHSLAVAWQLDVIYIDYVQLITPDNPRDVRHEQVARISRQLHTMAQTTGITAVALSQLSRPDKAAGRTKQVKGDAIPVEVPEPSMSDLRESGQLEQDADVILLLWRPFPSDSSNQDRKLKLAKNKEGISQKKLILGFDGATQRFSVKDPRSLSQRIRDAGKTDRPGSWASEAQAAKQMTMEELTGNDPDLPF